MFVTQSQLEEPLGSLLIPTGSEEPGAVSQVLPWEAGNHYLQFYLAFCGKTDDLERNRNGMGMRKKTKKKLFLWNFIFLTT